jgi:2'-5' RNA ligase
VVQSVELLLDAAGDAAVRADWEALAAAGLPSQGRHRSTSTRPHITVAVADRFPAGVETALADLRPPLPVPRVLGGLVVFGHRRLILARLVAPSTVLLALQASVAEVVRPAGPIQDTLRPDRWTPHITLARRLDPAGLARACSALPDRRVETAAIGIRRWDGQGRREWLLAGTAP